MLLYSGGQSCGPDVGSRQLTFHVQASQSSVEWQEKGAANQSAKAGRLNPPPVSKLVIRFTAYFLPMPLNLRNLYNS